MAVASLPVGPTAPKSARLGALVDSLSSARNAGLRSLTW